MRLVGTLAALFVAVVVLVGGARAEVASSSPTAFLVHAEAHLSATPDQAWRALVRPDRWWNPLHTYSGDARNLRLDPRAGGCWCERWGRGQVEHARVVMAFERDGVRTLRMIGGLGPLQELGPSAVMTYRISPDGDGAKVDLTYRVAGDAGLGLDHLAPLVDQVLMEQLGRLGRYLETGSPQ